ncbi:MAG: ATP-binding protein [Candidatus Moranbacteria bacterium]|nr:ATP-binding protein [Candidatus Moranbacteria bacterium]
MEFNLISNIENCYFDISPLIYYSHIPTSIAALILSVYVFFKNRSLAGGALLTIAVLFSLWNVVDLVVWVDKDSGMVMLFWSTLYILQSLILAATLYFSYVYLEKKDVPIGKKIIGSIFLLPLIISIPTEWLLTGFDTVICESQQGLLIKYFYYVQGIFLLWILLYFIWKFRNKSGKIEKRQTILFFIGVVFFLVAFTWGNFVGSLTLNWEAEQYGLIGMPVFIGFLAFLIVRYKAFDMKLLGAQALVAAQFILIGAMFFYAQSLTNKVLIGVTLFGTTIMGWYVIRSVKVEIERKEELQKISDALAIANTRLKELDLTKSEFISIASHQLRTPLTAIKGYISLILEGSYGKVPAVIQDVLDKVYTVNSRLVHLVEDLLNVSRIEAGRIQYSFAPTQLEPLVAELVEMFTSTAKQKNLFLKMQLAKKSLPQLTIDPNKIKEVLSNLIDNALKYTKEGGVTVSLESTPDIARIAVTDTGIGIRPEDEKNLFEKFVRTKETTKMVASGAGLGLYVGKNFVEAHGGRLFAESDGAGKGSRFIIELPLVNPNIHIGTSDQPSPSEKT